MSWARVTREALTGLGVMLIADTCCDFSVQAEGNADERRSALMDTDIFQNISVNQREISEISVPRGWRLRRGQPSQFNQYPLLYRNP
jgi:hypothetical protein